MSETQGAFLEDILLLLFVVVVFLFVWWWLLLLLLLLLYFTFSVLRIMTEIRTHATEITKRAICVRRRKPAVLCKLLKDTDLKICLVGSLCLRHSTSPFIS